MLSLTVFILLPCLFCLVFVVGGQQPSYNFVLDVQNDSPIFCGDQARIQVTVENNWQHMEYRYQLISESNEVIQQFYSTSKSEVFIYNTPETFCKNVTINATVSYQYKPGQWDVIASNQTTIQIDDAIYCDILATQDNKKTNQRSFNIGKIDFGVNVLDSNKYLTKLSYLYDFGDSTKAEQCENNSAVHVFTQEGDFEVSVYVNATGKDSRRRQGLCAVRIQIKAVLEIVLTIQQKSDRPRLPSFTTKYATGRVIYIRINVTDPYEFFKDANITYKYDYYDHTQLSNVDYTSINFTNPGTYNISTKAMAIKKSRKYVSHTQSTNIDVIEPITQIKVRRIQNENAIEVRSQQTFIITCNGSYPLSICWFISHYNCEFPSNIKCSWSFLQDDCQLKFNYTFWKSGRYCAIVSVRNQVGTNVLHQIINVDSIQENVKHREVGLVVIITVSSICLVLLCFYFIMKHTSKKSKRGRVTEEARFDFRDQSTAGESFSLFSSLPWNKVSTVLGHIKSFFTRCSCSTYTESEDDSEEECEEGEDQAFFTKTRRFNAAASRKKKKLRYSLQRKTSYYGTVHMNLAQQTEPIVDGDVFATSPGGRGHQPEEIGMQQIRSTEVNGTQGVSSLENVHC